MEEILASIRRIIEDNEAGSGQGVAASAAASAADPADDAPAAHSADVEEFRAELRPSFADRQDEPANKPASISEDKVHALNVKRDEAQAKPFDWMQSTGSAPSSAAAPASAEKSEEREERAWPPVGQADTRYDDAARPELQASPSQAEPAEEMAEATANTAPEMGNTASVGQNVEQVVRQSLSESTGRELATERKPILSEQSGRKVAAAFSELNEAFQASRRKGLDEVAEEMLRPMLQEWLDDNLPAIVERLVREEIERVARGG
ncbi:PopZ family protein [Nitratireductor basaltis]|nr:DUF2497 domain-containing protein [Nitratireductor basaltis]